MPTPLPHNDNVIADDHGRHDGRGCVYRMLGVSALRPTIILAAVLALTLPGVAQELPERPYPQGNAFPLGAFSLQPAEEMPQATRFGWNFGHSYQFDVAYLDAALANGLYSLASLPRPEGEVTWDTVRERVIEYAAYDNVVWWNLPEELRYWRADEWEMVERMPRLTRELDPQQRPNFMYFPNHYTAAAMARYVPSLDIIGAGVYVDSVGLPRSWVRWRIEAEIEAIERAGHEVGRDYLAGQRTPILVPMLFWRQGIDVIAPHEAYHDFWAGICAGARGVLVFSYWHQRDTEVLRQTWAAYSKAASEISGEERLGQVVLFGEPFAGLSFAVTGGPAMSAPFFPPGHSYEVRYPSLNVRGWRFEGNLYILAVNSAERAVTARLFGLPEGMTEARVLFETVTPEEDGEPVARTVPVVGGSIEDSFAGLGVHIYRLALPGEALAPAPG